MDVKVSPALISASFNPCKALINQYKAFSLEFTQKQRLTTLGKHIGIAKLL